MAELFDAVPGVYFFVKDRESKFMAAGKSFVRQLGVDDVKEIIGKTDHDFSADFLADGFLADDREVIRTRKPLLNKIELVPTEDSLDWLTTTKIPLFDRKGAVTGLAGLTRITRDSEALYRDHPEMHRIIDHIRANFRRKIVAADLAELVEISVSSVERLFKKTFGVSPNKYLRRTRLHAACQALRTTERAIAQIATDCGFADQTSMTRDFRSELNLTPARYRMRFQKNGRKLRRAA